jgi:soluble lytic murein transglycosylase
MFKNLLYFVVLISIILINFTNANSEDKKILPIKKPDLTVEEIEQKLSINILRPLEKPKDQTEAEIQEVNIEISEKKIAFIIPK